MNKDVLIKEIMKIKPVTVQPFTTVLEAAKMMKQNKIGNVIISEINHPIGILTESDIIKKVVCEAKNAQDVTVEEVMSSPIIIAEPFISLEEALKIMGKCNIRRLPIVENNELVGIITQRDISRLSPALTEISHEWSSIDTKDEEYLRSQTFSGKCEDCDILSTSLKSVDGRLLCEECIDGLKYE
ncbi:MAG TPA: CBS domain-containing protein [Thermoplasmata archaeon]|jgi:CBS domain-containing protein|nr:CBS domain-containing protein [Thermoplasmata archaeon]HIH29640.1 CBS domain-containing protein [Thermoplasmata archaeon]